MEPAARQNLSPAEQEFHARLDEAEGVIVNELPQEECPLSHAFLPGFYIRTIFMRAGLVITSAIHKTEHPFFIPTGDVIVVSPSGRQRFQGPCHGITTPGTRRILYILADTVWTTYHRTNTTDPLELARELVEPVTNPHLPKGYIPCHSR
jgi:hypothetical protein